MLSQEELEKVYQENFPVGISLEAAAERLAAMDADYVDDIREMFCNNLLYSITQNYTKYADLDFSRDTVSAFSATMWHFYQRKMIISAL